MRKPLSPFLILSVLLPSMLVDTGSGLMEADVPVVSPSANQAAIAQENAHLYQAERTAR